MSSLSSLRGAMGAFMALDLLVVLARIWVRVKLAKVGYDDYIIVMALAGFVLMSSFCFTAFSYGFGISDAAAIAKMKHYNQMLGTKFFTIAQITYVASFPIVRVSIALVLLRIVPDTMRRIRLMLIVSVCIVSVYAFACLLVDTFQCIPLGVVWGEGTGKCISFSSLAGLGFAVSALDIASALFYAVLPVFLLKGLQIGLRTKLAIMFLLGCGAVTVVITIIRLRSLVLLVHSKNLDETLSLELESFLYSVLELGVSIFTASLVALRPMIKYLPFGSHGHSSDAKGASARLGNANTGGTRDFEMINRANDPSAESWQNSDDADSQRDILTDEDNRNKVWMHHQITVTFEPKPAK